MIRLRGLWTLVFGIHAAGAAAAALDPALVPYEPLPVSARAAPATEGRTARRKEDSMTSRYPAAALLALALIATTPTLAGVTVVYGNPDRFTDAGDRNSDPVKIMKVLADHMKKVADQVVPAGTDVRIEVLDLDRAGRTRMNLPTEIRVMTGRADPPCMDVRYTVTTQGQAAEPRKEQVCDVNYLRPLDPRDSENDPLVYEKRMVAEWIRQRFGASR